MKFSDLIEGTVVEFGGSRYEKVSATSWKTLSVPNVHPRDVFSFDELGILIENVKIISVPYEVAVLLATWLDSVGMHHDDPEKLIVEAFTGLAMKRINAERMFNGGL